MNLATIASAHPRVIDGGIRLDRVPAAAWLALQTVALWPTWTWMARRVGDGSDDPLGLLAIAALVALVASLRGELRAAPRLGWLLLASLGTLAATALHGALPPLLSGLVAVLAWACGLLAFLPRRVAALPVAGLAVLALPLLSSLQFYAGYPLRVLTAEASRWLLMPGFEVSREGSTLWVEGRLVIVDAPCSGVQMVWLGYFTACAVALWARRSDRSFAARLPVVGLLVLAGNVVRNSVLVALEGAGQAPAPGVHDALGLLVLAVVCAGIARAMGRATPADASASQAGLSMPWLERWLANRFVHRIAHKALFGVAMAVCAVASVAQAWQAPTSLPAQAFHEWPSTWDGAPLRPLALSEVEHRFAQRFPGAIARMTDGQGVFVLRHVAAPTRMLHPAADCYRALGYRVAQVRLENDEQARLWRCFSATRKRGETLRVCERIVDAKGRAFTDTSAWYWAAAAGQSQGPWQAVTVARSMGDL
ncbi:exosortase Q [Variovorax sp. LT2P21]|uniref:exosortase Q n=1 Tax=Variovorax sp. LT2P21 TaxID=3443731 RepID=UPI003F447802